MTPAAHVPDSVHASYSPRGEPAARSSTRLSAVEGGPDLSLATEGAGTGLAAPDAARAYLVIHVGGEQQPGSRVIELHDGVDVTFGRSRGATVTIDHVNLSRLHARVRRTGDVVEVEDLGSRNGTRVNGEPLAGVRRIASGDELTLGPIQAVLTVTSGARRASPVIAADDGMARLAAEVFRAVRYRRPVTVALVRCAHDGALDTIARSLRPMDVIAEDVGDDYLVVLPELDATAGGTALVQLQELGRAVGGAVAVAALCCPDDATTADAVIARLRGKLRGEGAPPADPAAPLVIDPAMQRVYATVARIAASNLTLLVLGETGVGKELVALALHRASSRRDHPLIKLNCAALAENLLESELFGHERGAFTGADRRKIGFFEAADGGTLFLDEIGEMPLALQAKLLRVLERRVVTRVGGTTEIPTDVRVVAATHRDLEAEVAAGRFRQDLLFRIGGFTVVVPPLRDRVREIAPLAERFAAQAAAEQGRATPAFTAEARAALERHAWPGNVRELKNAIERALVLCDDRITPADLPDRVREQAPLPAAALGAAIDVRGQVAEVERSAIVAALAAEGDNQTRAARRLGMSRRALIYKMEKYGLKPAPAPAR